MLNSARPKVGLLSWKLIGTSQEKAERQDSGYTRVYTEVRIAISATE